MSELVVIAGMSGAGRTVAADNLEDLGWFVMDNLPPALIPKVAELADGSSSAGDRLALVVGSGRYHEEMAPLVSLLRSKFNRVQLIFLDASTEVLIRRYESSRRVHPFGSPGAGTLVEVIEAERVALEPLRAGADLVLDTSDLNVHQLRERMVDAFSDGGAGHTMHTTVTSFGYKHGLPLDVDMVIDCRFLPNPHWVDELRPLTGLDQAVSEYVLEQSVTGAFLSRLERLLALILPFYVQEGKSYLTIAFGCTGGRHRSVAIAEQMATVLEQLGHAPAVVHRDVGK
ncbi:MAG: RNase adapter RapZ [Acidimicrobiales bacterium]